MCIGFVITFGILQNGQQVLVWHLEKMESGLSWFRALWQREPSNASRRISPVEELTRKLIDFNTSIEELNGDMVSLPKARRGSVKLGERMFMSLISACGVSDIIEAGGLDGRHSRRFMAETESNVHVFEPNPFTIGSFAELVGNSRFFYNPYGLSNETRLVKFGIPTRILGQDLSFASGISSVEARDSVEKAKACAAVLVRADQYFEIHESITNGRVAVWLDVEGHADLALEGFGRFLRSNVDIILVETEYDDIYARGSNFASVLTHLSNAGLTVVYRDFMNVGQCNLLAIREQHRQSFDRVNVEMVKFYRQITAKYCPG